MNPLGIIPKIIGGGLLAVILALGLMLLIQKGETQHWRKTADGRQATIAKLLQAQALANAQATSAKLAAEAEHARIKREQDSESQHAKILAADNARLRQWVRDHPAYQGQPGQSDLPRAAGAAEQPDGPDPVAAVDGRYLAICAANTRRLLNAQEWGLKIQATQEGKQ